MKNRDKQSKQDTSERPDIIVAHAIAKAIDTIANATAEVIPKISGKQIGALVDKVIKLKDANEKKRKNKT